MKRTKRKRKRTKRISGRKAEKLLQKKLSDKHTRSQVYLMPQDKFTPTLCDIIMFTRTKVLAIEVKATSTDAIKKYNIRKNQIERLTKFGKLNKQYIPLICLYYAKEDKFYMFKLNQLSKLPSTIKVGDLNGIGKEI